MSVEASSGGGSPDVVLEARHVTKRYGGQTALKSVTFRVHRGKVNVLIGENGAGKSTLMRLLAGAEQPDGGELVMEGKTLDLRSPLDAARQGISMVHQELAVFGNLDLAENIFAGRELVRSALLVDRQQEDRRSATALAHLGKPMDVRLHADALSLGNRQIVELARSLAHGARVLILDEPTSALSATEAQALFAVVEELKNRGVSIVYISHRLHELMLLGDRFTVMRDGRIVGEGVRGEVDRQWIVERMSGGIPQPRSRQRQGNTTHSVLEVDGLSSRETGRAALHAVSLRVATGEIVGVYGLLGSGRTELLHAIAGVRAPDAGGIRVNGRVVPPGSVARAIACGVTLVPEDRQGEGLVPELSVRENISLASLGSFTQGGLLRRRRERPAVEELVRKLRIAASDLELPVSTLSGGNQQKVILARCLMRRPVVLLLDEPTRGVDVRAKAEIYGILQELAEEGLSVLFTSSEIEETQTLADRVVVLAGGRVSAQLAAAEATDAALFTAASPAAEGRPA